MDKINGVAGTLLINSGLLDSSGESTKAFEDLLSSLNTSANTVSSILKQTSAYINMINEDFKEIDHNQATNFNLT